MCFEIINRELHSQNFGRATIRRLVSFNHTAGLLAHQIPKRVKEKGQSLKQNIETNSKR
jgi:predicted transcriptional regulator